MFNVVYQPSFNLILATLSGLLSVEEVGRYVNEIEPVIQRASARVDGYRILLDVCECAIQPQAVVAAFQQHLARVPNARRCAVVTGRSTVRMQIRRILGEASTARAFEEYEQAHAWLRGEALRYGS